MRLRNKTVKLLPYVQKTACLTLDQINGYSTGYFMIVCYRYATLTDCFVISVTGTQQSLIIFDFCYGYAALTGYFVNSVTGTQR